MAVEDYDYAEQFSEFSFRTLVTKGEVISALGKIKVECSKVTKQCMFTTIYNKSLRLDEMEQGQLQAIDQVGNYLKDTWAVALKNAIKNSFKDVGKGWFNLHESNMEVSTTLCTWHGQGPHGAQQARAMWHGQEPAHAVYRLNVAVAEETFKVFKRACCVPL